MTVSKCRISRANARARRSQWKGSNVTLQEVGISSRVYDVPRCIARTTQFDLVGVGKF